MIVARYPYFPESALAHRHIDPLQPGPGVEIGGSAQNEWGIPNTLNVDYTLSLDTLPKLGEIELTGRTKAIDVVADACSLPLPDSSQSWLLHSHVFEHLPDPLRALHEWHRVLRHGAILYSVVCLRDALPMDALQPVTGLDHYLEDHRKGATWATHPPLPGHDAYGHCHVYTMASFLGLVAHFDPAELKLKLIDVLEHDDKVGNGFTTVHRVSKVGSRQ